MSTERTAAAVIAASLLGFAAILLVGSSSERDQCEPSSRDGCLVIVQRMQGGYIEGSLSFVQVSGEGVSIERQLEGGGFTRVTSIPLDPGRYTVTSYQRPCMAACPPDGPLDPRTDECGATFEIRYVAPVDIETVATARIVVTPFEGCRIKVRD